MEFWVNSLYFRDQSGVIKSRKFFFTFVPKISSNKHNQIVMIKKAFAVLIKVTVLLLLVLFVFSCKEKKGQEKAPPEITVVNVLQKDVPVYSEFVGQVYGNRDIPIRARVSGFLEGIFFKEGHTVKKGQLLYTIDPTPFQAKVAMEESTLAEAKTMFAKAESDLNRIKPLAKINAVSQSDLDAAVAQYEAAKASVEAAKSGVKIAKINLGYCWVKSPINGIIGKTKAKVGEFVGQNPNPVILNTVSDIDSVLVEFFLTERDYLRLAKSYIYNKNQNYDYEDEDDISLILSDGTVFGHKGRIKFVDRNVDPGTGSLLVQTVFPNPDKLLRPGLYSKVKLKMETRKGAVIIPQRSIMELQGQFSVFVVNNENKVEARKIKTGEKYGEYIVVSEGLKSGEKIVIDALQKVKSGITVVPKVIEFKSKNDTTTE